MIARHYAPVVIMAAACSASIEPPPPSPPSPDDWPRSAIWIHATADATPGRASECEHVHRSLGDEDRCDGALCRPATELAEDWLSSCAGLMPTAVASVEAIVAELRPRAGEPPTKCAKQFERFVDDGCERRHCLEDAQVWATRCAESEGSALTVRMLERVVARHLADNGEPISLDARSCDSLARAVKQGAWCGTVPACKRERKTIKVERRRCGHDPPHDIARATQELIIAIGADRNVTSMRYASTSSPLHPGDAPLVLESGSGAIVSVCAKRVTTVDDYLKQRSGCDGGFVTFVHTTKTGSLVRGDLRVSQAGAAEDMFSQLRVVGEAKSRAVRVAKQLASELDRAIETGGRDGVNLLIRSFAEHGAWLEAAPVSQAVRSRDVALIPLLERVAQAKSVMTKTMVGVAHRARSRPFSDLSSDGTLDAMSDTAARWLVLSPHLPKAMVAYTRRLAPVIAGVTRAPPPTRQAEKLARTEALACQTQLERMRAARSKLWSCAFDDCSSQNISDWTATMITAKDAALRHFRATDLALTRAHRDDAQSLAEDVGCTIEWL